MKVTYKLISRARAKELGLKLYNTGYPCKNGHRAPRRVATYKCTECQSEWMKIQHSKTKDKLSKCSEEAQAEHRKKVAEYHRKRYNKDVELSRMKARKRERARREKLRLQRKDETTNNVTTITE